MIVRQCEICGQWFDAGYGYCFAGAWYATGSAYVEAHMCDKMPGGQHWGCTPEHAMQAFEQCLDNHLTINALMKRHEEAHKIMVPDGTNEDGTPKYKEGSKPRYSPEDETRYRDKGDNFHFLTIS